MSRRGWLQRRRVHSVLTNVSVSVSVDVSVDVVVVVVSRL